MRHHSVCGSVCETVDYRSQIVDADGQQGTRCSALVAIDSSSSARSVLRFGSPVSGSCPACCTRLIRALISAWMSCAVSMKPVARSLLSRGAPGDAAVHFIHRQRFTNGLRVCPPTPTRSGWILRMHEISDMPSHDHVRLPAQRLRHRRETHRRPSRPHSNDIGRVFSQSSVLLPRSPLVVFGRDAAR